MAFFVGGIILAPLALWLLGVIGQRIRDRLKRPTMAERMRQRRRYSYLETMCTGQGEPLVLRQAERVAGTRWRVWE